MNENNYSMSYCDILKLKNKIEYLKELLENCQNIIICLKYHPELKIEEEQIQKLMRKIEE